MNWGCRNTIFVGCFCSTLNMDTEGAFCPCSLHSCPYLCTFSDSLEMGMKRSSITGNRGQCRQ